MKDLPGGVVIWVFAMAELATFALFFLSYAWYAVTDPAVFQQAQGWVHPLSGAINTGVLLTASWGAARAVGRDWRWWLVPGIAGLVYLGIKASEYVGVFAHGITLSTNMFWFFYLFLTFFHALHVVGGIVVAGLMAFHNRRSDDHRGEPDEAAAVYWHVVDLIWIVLFPLLYLIHPGGLA